MKSYGLVTAILLLSVTTQCLTENQGNKAATERLAKSFDTLNAKIDLEMLKQTITDGADLEMIISSETPLMKAIYYNNQEAIKLLLDAGANINGTNKEGITPLMRAVTPYSVIESLDRDLAGTAKKHPGSIEILYLLITHGADINAQNKYGNTALMIAVRSAQPIIVEYLLKHNVKTDFKNKQQKTAFELKGQYKRNPVGPRASQEKKARTAVDKVVHDLLQK